MAKTGHVVREICSPTDDITVIIIIKNIYIAQVRKGHKCTKATNTHTNRQTDKHAQHNTPQYWPVAVLYKKVSEDETQQKKLRNN